MLKYISLLGIAFILSLSSAALAAETGSGTIEGSVVNGTMGGSSVADLELTMTAYVNNAEADSFVTKTDNEGLFVFTNLPSEAGYLYEVKLTFQEAEYYSEPLIFQEGETRKSTTIAVYDSTASDESIRIATAHTIAYVEQGNLTVKEYYLFVNESDRTYIGSDNEERKETLIFALPEGATELQATLGLMECCIFGNEDGFVDSMPVLPGSREVAYSYTIVPSNSKNYTFNQAINYHTMNFDFLIQSEGLEISSSQLETGEPMDIEGITFTHLSGGNLSSDDTVEIQLSGLSGTSNQGAVIGGILALIITAGGFVSVYLLRRKKVQVAGVEESLAHQKQNLLVELVKLDDDFNSDKIAEGTYNKLRKDKKAQLVRLMQMLKEEGD